MSDRLYLDAKVALDGARNLTGGGQHYLNLLTTTGRQLSDQTQRRPWGKDDIGQAVESNYRPIEQQVFEPWGNLADYVLELGAAVEANVADNQQADEESGIRVTRAYRERQ